MGPELKETSADKAGMLCMQSAPSPPSGMIFTFKRVREDLDPGEPGFTPNEASRRRLAQVQADCGSDDEQNLFRALRHRPWISYHESETSSEDESDSEQMYGAGKSSPLPAGVIRGCPYCKSCQKVLARWQPEAGCRPSLEEAPVFFPLEEEFKDTMKYIASISAEGQQYGICRIVPPQSWRPPCPLKDCEKRQTARFPTRVQQVHKLQVREAQTKRYAQSRKRRRGRPSRMGGYMGRRSLAFGEASKGVRCESPIEDDKFGFEPGPKFTIEAFEKYAHQFKDEYFGNNLGCGESNKWEPSVTAIEAEYWRIVEHATEQIEVLYGADVETGEFGSGFPKAKPEREPTSYESSGWNLNNIARLPGSVLAFEEGEISGVLVPWLYVGMCFSSFCWHVEDHHFYSLNYMHWGSPKVWYGVPGSAAHKLEEAMKKHLPDLFEEQPDLLHKLVTQLSPSVLKAAGVPVYRAVQKAGEFVVTFPRAYHAGFNCGFNCAEAVNVAPVDWLPHGQSAVELYREQRRKSSVSHDKLLVGAAKQAVKTLQQFREVKEDVKAELGMSGWRELFCQDEVLRKALKTRVDMERVRRADLVNLVHVRKMDRCFDAIHERECYLCHYDLHLSAVGCECVPERYTCLEHLHHLCACGQTRKFALYRYDIADLDTLVAALEGQPGAVNTWLNLEKELSLKSPSISGTKPLRHSLDEISTSITSSQKSSDNSREELHPISHEHDSPCQSTMRVSALMDVKDKLSSGMMYIGCAWNQQGQQFENPKPTIETQQGLSFVQQGSCSVLPNCVQKFKGSSEEKTLDSQESIRKEVVALPVVGSHASHATISGFMEEIRKSELGTWQSLSSPLNTDSKSRLQIAGCASQEIHDGTPGQPNDEKRLCAARENIFPLERAFSGQGSQVKFDMELIVLSDDEEEDTGGAFSAGSCADKSGQRTNNFSQKVENGVSLKDFPAGAVNKEEPNMFLSNILRDSITSPREEFHQDRSIASAGVVRPELGMKSQNPTNVRAACLIPPLSTGSGEKGASHFEALGRNAKLLCEGQLEPSVSQSFLVRKKLSSQQLRLESLLSHGSFVEEAKEYKGIGSILTTEHNQVSFVAKGLGSGACSFDGYPSLAQPEETGYNVQLLNAGRLVLRKSWSNKHAIFPAGFMSRVLFRSILDPLQSCFYISEVLDCGHAEPLFKVIMEDHPSEVFIHPCIDRCWQMVQERVNMTIQLQHDLGKKNLPPLRLHVQLQGIELFGFTSPHIIKAVESLDWQHQCIEYWAGRLSAVELLESQHQVRVSYVNGAQCTERSDSFRELCEASNFEACIGDACIDRFAVEVSRSEDSRECSSRDRESEFGMPQPNRKLYNTLKGLFKRATPGELWTLHRLFNSEWGGLEWREGFKALKDELEALC